MANYRAKAKWASLAKVEAQKISERTRAGMARAKAQGKRISRPTLSLKLQQIAERIAAGAVLGARSLHPRRHGADYHDKKRADAHDSTGPKMGVDEHMKPSAAR
jgi:DNA invertase Pin-like site-specific DNA recombinase